MKNIIVTAALGGVFTVLSVHAAGNGNINFSGRLVNQTCDASVSGGGNNATVTLPSVQSGVLATSGSTAGTTNFSITMTNCNRPSASGSGSVKAFFEQGPNVDTNGRLVNTSPPTSGGATNVVLQLIDNSTRNPIIIGDTSQATTNDIPYNNGYTVIGGGGAAQGSAILSYAVRYYATNAAISGRVTSAVTYSMVYY